MIRFKVYAACRFLLPFLLGILAGYYFWPTTYSCY